ncbi:MAG TPA: BlaI/MecI/CopY family transcriptional regulator [Gemmatimonadales bacterium]
MTQLSQDRLSRRERQIMDVVYRLGEATAHEVRRQIPGDPGYDSVRVTLGILGKKGFLRHRREGQRYVYSPTIPLEQATESALSHMVRTFFRGQPTKAILALLDMRSTDLTAAQLDEIAHWIEQARKES